MKKKTLQMDHYSLSAKGFGIRICILRENVRSMQELGGRTGRRDGRRDEMTRKEGRHTERWRERRVKELVERGRECRH